MPTRPGLVGAMALPMGWVIGCDPSKEPVMIGMDIAWAPRSADCADDQRSHLCEGRCAIGQSTASAAIAAAYRGVVTVSMRQTSLALPA